MKKRLRRLLIASAAFTAVFGGMALAGCENVLDHPHIWGEWEVVTPATCTEAGTKRHHCLDPNCSASETVSLDAQGHTYDNGVFVSGNCTEGGVIRLTCTVCGNINEETAAEAREHEFEEKEVIQVANCQQSGSSKFVCKVCGKEEIQDVAQKPHDDEILEQRAATCKEAGYVKKKCKVCGTITEEYPEQLEHTWAPGSEKEVLADCTHKGVKSRVCSKCGKRETIETDPLGHDYVVKETIYPTFDEDGKETSICSRCSDKKEEVLDKLVDGQEVEFQVQLYRNNGQKYTGTSAKIAIYNGETELASGQYKEITGGLLKAKFEVHRGEKYTVKITECPKGYSAEEGVEISPEHPVVNVYMTASIQNTTENISLYSVGSVMNDFTYQTTDGVEFSLSGLLETHDAVLINFFYVHCTYCDIEFPALVDTYKKYDKKFALIALADRTSPNNHDLALVKKYKTEMEITDNIYFVSDYDQPVGKKDGADVYLGSLFSIQAWPTTVVIDKEGVVIERHGSAFGATYDQNKENLETFFQSLSQITYRTDAEETDGLETAVLRGDYLPVFDEEK